MLSIVIAVSVTVRIRYGNCWYDCLLFVITYLSLLLFVLLAICFCFLCCLIFIVVVLFVVVTGNSMKQLYGLVPCWSIIFVGSLLFAFVFVVCCFLVAYLFLVTGCLVVSGSFVGVVVIHHILC